jgi:hypothetical protein
MKLRFGKIWKKYLLEVTRDETSRLGEGTIGKGDRVLKDKTVKVAKDSIIMNMESKVLKGEDGKPLTFKMIFGSEEEAFQYLTYKKGGMKQSFLPDRSKGFVEHQA